MLTMTLAWGDGGGILACKTMAEMKWSIQGNW
jgi:hypothetical protein